MADNVIIDPNVVDWSGENPGMYLKTAPEGPFVTLLSFFRVVMSPHGRGQVLVMLQSPQSENSPAEAPNLCITNNEPLARYLVSSFVSQFAAFRGAPGLKGLAYRSLTFSQASGDARTSYVETVKSADLEVRMTWDGIGTPFLADVPPEKSATGKHRMVSLFAGAEKGIITVNGRSLPGKPMPRDMYGRQMTTAFLAFSETWVRL
jgi:hypothetical protein